MDIRIVWSGPILFLPIADFHVAASNPTFQDLAKDGVLLTNYLALTQCVVNPSRLVGRSLIFLGGAMQPFRAKLCRFHLWGLLWIRRR
jgi:hypothetical protein